MKLCMYVCVRVRKTKRNIFLSFFSFRQFTCIFSLSLFLSLSSFSIIFPLFSSESPFPRFIISSR